jgi:hypothetical protein
MPDPADPRLARILAAPTIGAVMRARGHTGMSDRALRLLAQAFLDEWARRQAIDRLDGILLALDHSVPWQHIAARLRALADQLDHAPAVAHEEAA